MGKPQSPEENVHQVKLLINLPSEDLTNLLENNVQRQHVSVVRKTPLK